MWIELVEVLGNIEYQNYKIGRALLFNIGDDTTNFECIMYVKKGLNSFVTIPEDVDYKESEILNAIISKYTLEELYKL